jgi:DNA-binding protein YbaB
MAEIESRQAELESLIARQAQMRQHGTSDDGTVQATVDGNRRLLAIDIAPHAFRQEHPQLIAPAIMTAISRAKAMSGSAATREEPRQVPESAPAGVFSGIGDDQPAQGVPAGLFTGAGLADEQPDENGSALFTGVHDGDEWWR